MEDTKAKGRSRASNGHGLLGEYDGRSSVARRYRDLLKGLHSDLHWDTTHPVPLAEQVAAQRLAGVLVALERLEALLVAGDPAFDNTNYLALTKQASKLFQRLGLEPSKELLEQRQMMRSRW